MPQTIREFGTVMTVPEHNMLPKVKRTPQSLRMLGFGRHVIQERVNLYKAHPHFDMCNCLDFVSDRLTRADPEIGMTKDRLTNRTE